MCVHCENLCVSMFYYVSFQLTFVSHKLTKQYPSPPHHISSLQPGAMTIYKCTIIVVLVLTAYLFRKYQRPFLSDLGYYLALVPIWLPKAGIRTRYAT